MNKDTNIAAGELSLRSCIFTEQSNIGTRLPLVEEKVIFQKCFCLVKKMISANEAGAHSVHKQKREECSSMG